MKVKVTVESTRNAAIVLLQDWFFRRIDETTRIWFEEQVSLLRSDSDDRVLYTAFGLMPRRLGKKSLALSADDAGAAAHCLEGWNPGDWSLVDAGRILLLARLPGSNPDFARRFCALCRTADVAEAISLYRGLPLYPEPAALEPQVGEGLRTNMRSVFEAIAHHNPYPKRYFDTHRWNHMVLKALFIGSGLAPIEGLDERVNDELAQILLDFAHERWAADRPVPHELWRCVGRFARGDALEDLARVVCSGTPLERRAAALALSVSPDPAAAELLEQIPEIAQDIDTGRLTWTKLE